MQKNKAFVFNVNVVLKMELMVLLLLQMLMMITIDSKSDARKNQHEGPTGLSDEKLTCTESSF
jgi:hypothetical protein